MEISHLFCRFVAVVTGVIHHDIIEGLTWLCVYVCQREVIVQQCAHEQG